MPLHAPVHDRGADLLAGYITHQLDAIRNAAFGLTDDEARQTTTASRLSIGGIVKHTARTISAALDRVQAAPASPPPSNVPAEEGFAAYRDTFDPHEPLGDLLAELDAVRTRVADVVPSLDLDTPVPVPRHAPWFPQGASTWPIRWDLLHWVEEVARHAGHADIVRESLDGADSARLVAAVEDWPSDGWIAPWPAAEEPAS